METQTSLGLKDVLIGKSLVYILPEGRKEQEKQKGLNLTHDLLHCFETTHAERFVSASDEVWRFIHVGEGEQPLWGWKHTTWEELMPELQQNTKMKLSRLAHPGRLDELLRNHSHCFQII